MKKKILIKSKTYFVYEKKDLVLVIMIIKSIIKPDIIRISQENIEKATHSICNLRYKISKEITVAFHDVSTYDYHFIIKELAKEFEGQFECLGGSTEKYITFSVSINKELDKSKLITKLSKLITKYKLRFIDSFRFMSTLLSKLVNILSEFYSKKCRDKDCKSECEFKGLENNKLCKDCRKNGYNQ